MIRNMQKLGALSNVSVFLLFSELDTLVTVYFIVQNPIKSIFLVVISVCYLLSTLYQVKINGFKGLPYLRLYYRVQLDKLGHIVIVGLEDFVVMWVYINDFDSFDNISKIIFTFEVFWFTVHANSISRKYFHVSVLFFSIVDCFLLLMFGASIFIINNVFVTIVYSIAMFSFVVLLVRVWRYQTSLYMHMAALACISAIAMILRLSIEFNFPSLLSLWTALLFINLLYKNRVMKCNYYYTGKDIQSTSADVNITHATHITIRPHD